MNEFDLFLPYFLQRGPFFGRQVPWLHYGRPVRPVRWGVVKRGFTTTVFVGTAIPPLSSGDHGYGDPAIVDGPDPMYPGAGDTPDPGNAPVMAVQA